jgi:hypothetical protein
MISGSSLVQAFVAPSRSGSACRAITLPENNFARAAHGLWMGIENVEWVPEFNSENFGRPPAAHPTLSKKVAQLKLLPDWRSDSRPINSARILAQGFFSVWGDSDALSLLQLVGPNIIIKAYDEGNWFALSACAVAYTLIEADHSVRERLGELVADEIQMVDVLSKIQFSNYDKPIPMALNADPVPDISPTKFSYNHADNSVLHVQINHPELKPSKLLTDVVRLYENKRALASFGVEDIATLLNEPISEHHVASYFTLVDAPFHHVCNSIDSIPEPVFMSFEWSDCKHAFEQCCRYFGEDFMLQTTFGKHPSTTHETLFKDRLMKILPVMQRFLNGDEASWS